MIGELVEELKKLHGDKLDFDKHHYFVFFQDGVFDVYFDEDEKSIKVDVAFSDGIKIYHSKKEVADLLNIKKARD